MGVTSHSHCCHSSPQPSLQFYSSSPSAKKQLKGIEGLNPRVQGVVLWLGNQMRGTQRWLGVRMWFQGVGRTVMGWLLGVQHQSY